jgi:hypothetical protein
VPLLKWFLSQDRPRSNVEGGGRLHTLTLTLLSLAFTPAPFPKAERRPRESERTRLVREYDARLRELGVKWELRTGKVKQHVRQHVSFEIRHNNTLEFTGSCVVNDGNAPAALETILNYVMRRRDAPK